MACIAGGWRDRSTSEIGTTQDLQDLDCSQHLWMFGLNKTHAILRFLASVSTSIPLALVFVCFSRTVHHHRESNLHLHEHLY